MTKIVLNTHPLKVINKGGFQRQSNKKQYAAVPSFLHPEGKETQVRTHLQITTQRVAGASYYVFECPACGKRNKRPALRANYSTESRIAFLCNGCSRIVEMEKQAPTPPKSESRIILP